MDPSPSEQENIKRLSKTVDVAALISPEAMNTVTQEWHSTDLHQIQRKLNGRQIQMLVRLFLAVVNFYVFLAYSGSR